MTQFHPVLVMPTLLLGKWRLPAFYTLKLGFNRFIFALNHMNVHSFIRLLIHAKAFSLSIDQLTGSLRHYQCIT